MEGCRATSDARQCACILRSWKKPGAGGVRCFGSDDMIVRCIICCCFFVVKQRRYYFWLPNETTKGAHAVKPQHRKRNYLFFSLILLPPLPTFFLFPLYPSKYAKHKGEQSHGLSLLLILFVCLFLYFLPKSLGDFLERRCALSHLPSSASDCLGSSDHAQRGRASESSSPCGGSSRARRQRPRHSTRS